MEGRTDMSHEGFATSDEWTTTARWSTHGRTLVGGLTEVSIAGVSGRFVFRRHVSAPGDRAWIDVFGGRTGYQTIRSFRPDRIKTVHRTRKARPE
jgi:hypothetical protein